MVEQGTINIEEKLTQHIYSNSLDLLQRYGKRFYNYDGIKISAKSFFCDEEDVNGSSDIILEADATDKISDSVTLILVRHKESKDFIRELTFENSKVTGLKVRERETHGAHFAVKTTYSGRLDRARISLEAVSKYLDEARINLEAQAEHLPCEDEKKSRLVNVTTKIKDRFFNSFTQRR